MMTPLIAGKRQKGGYRCRDVESCFPMLPIRISWAPVPVIPTNATEKVTPESKMAGLSTRSRVKWSDLKFQQTDDNLISKLGAFSKVYRGTATEYVKEPGKTTRTPVELNVAVKILNVQDPDTRRQVMFAREVEAMQKVSHPCLLGLVSWSMFPYGLATELAHVGLGEVFGQEERSIQYSYDGPNGRVEWNDTKRSICAFGIAVGMCCLHEATVIHRDLKPDNVMLDERLWPKVADFGLSRVFDMGERMAKEMYDMTMNVGTPIYMAPEIFAEMNEERASRTVDKYTNAVDVWSYGMILYQLVTQVKPWTDRIRGQELTRFNLLRFLRDGMKPELPSFVQGPYRELIEACLSIDPTGRPTFRQIVEQTNNDRALVFEETDLEEFAAYREEVLRALPPPKNKM
jgi:serine/threonine protein kinase